MISSETSWTWLDDGNPVGPDGYVNFQDDGSTDADNMCTVMVSDRSWMPTPCDQPFPFVCQMPAGIFLNI